ncbi:divalent cation tolerance protein [Methylophilus rhizosphaerae]|uniref:Divalent cation tolerance protein n=1 Tax=Methylophilus rhizosphaerae TaxID=492660 RepID=A0A1G9EEY5_9PROT|nr:divalent-cation tolerance protein CutA [Methylophilus rhizosphaerae]SDK74595.1 divalent cation tolerance protein [Methylophilus rhizosphaerae]
MTPKEQIIIVFTHVPNMACAESMAHALVTEQLAACVNISSPVKSVYRWQGQIETAAEIGLSIKTTCDGYARLADRIRALHPYELPEIVAIHVNEGLPEYLHWVAAETRA